MFFAYIGFDGVSTLAEETKNPQRTVPWALFASLFICTVLYVGVSLVITGLTDYRSLDVPDPLYYALSASHMPLVWLKGRGRDRCDPGAHIGSARKHRRSGADIFCDGARRAPAASLVPPRQAPPHALRGHARDRHHHGGRTAGFAPLDLLGDLISIGTLLAFAVVCGGILILRRIAPGARRPFRTPWVPLVPILGVLSCLALMLSLPNGTWWRLALWINAGIAMYAFYGRRHSKLRKELALR